MKHWDLFPNEHVTLRSSTGQRLSGRYLFRDTARAYFAINEDDGEEHFRWFDLLDEGDLIESRRGREMMIHAQTEGHHRSARMVRAALGRRPKWEIEGRDRTTNIAQAGAL